MGAPVGCTANFWVLQAYNMVDGEAEPIPNEIWLLNVSESGNGEIAPNWDFGDGTSSSEEYLQHEYDGPGPYQVCLTITDPAGCSDTYCHVLSLNEDGLLNGMIAHPTPDQVFQRSGGFTLRVIPALPTGMAELPATVPARQWPNPVQDVLNLEFDSPGSMPLAVAVIDATGSTVRSVTHRVAAGRNTVALDTRDLLPGVYMVRLGSGTHQKAQRFVKVR